MEAIARRIPPGSVIADVGTDHGLLPVYLVATGIVRSALGVEQSHESVALARRNALRFDVAVDIRQGSGLNPLTAGEAEVLVLAGLGGQTITEILAERTDVVMASSTLVLQPMRDTPQLRRWMIMSGMGLLDEDLVRDGGHLYSVLTARPGDFVPQTWDPSEASAEHEIPPQLLHNPSDILLEYLRRRLRIRESIADKLEKSCQPVPDFHYAVISSIRQAVQGLIRRTLDEKGGGNDER